MFRNLNLLVLILHHETKFVCKHWRRLHRARPGRREGHREEQKTNQGPFTDHHERKGMRKKFPLRSLFARNIKNIHINFYFLLL